MTKRTRNTLFISLAIGLLVFSGLYFVRSILGAFAPADIMVTPTEISSSRGFINPITIEKIRVDSIGEEQRPVKYNIEYIATCSIQQREGSPPVALKTIKLNKAGRYSWSQEKVSIPIYHNGIVRNRMDSQPGIIWSNGPEAFDVCPLKLERGNWYFVNILDPSIVGVYLYIDKKGDTRQYTIYSGVSPI